MAREGATDAGGIFFPTCLAACKMCAPAAAMTVRFSTSNEITTRIKEFPLPLHMMFFPFFLFDFFANPSGINHKTGA